MPCHAEPARRRLARERCPCGFNKVGSQRRGADRASGTPTEGRNHTREISPRPRRIEFCAREPVAARRWPGEWRKREGMTMRYLVMGVAAAALAAGAQAQQPAWGYFDADGSSGAGVQAANGAQFMLKCDKPGRGE